MAENYDISVIGAGIVGMSVAMQLAEACPGLKICVLEKEASPALHQTGHNSGVIHSGIYYRPGSLKALTCQEGIRMLHTFCDRHGVPYETTGKVIVALKEDELPGLGDLLKRGEANGVRGLKIISSEEVHELEPAAHALKGLFVPITGIIDYSEVVRAFVHQFEKAGGIVHYGAELVSIRSEKHGMLKLFASGRTLDSRFLINCAGLFSDRVSKISGVNPGLRIVPFRGEYYKISREKHHLVNHLIYPVPDPEFPFLGVHFTRMINGECEVGPNAVLAFKREGYTKMAFSLRDTFSTFSYPGFWKMALRHWKMGLNGMRMSFFKSIFVSEARKMIPAISADDLSKATPGVRAQALESNGKLVDDFRLLESPRMLHVLNAPSPAATASLAIGKQIVSMAIKNFKIS